MKRYNYPQKRKLFKTFLATDLIFKKLQIGQI